MRKELYLLIVFILCIGCEKNNSGNIYGIVAEYTTAEPLRAAGVSLYVEDNLLLKTVTYDDGHFEFNDLEAGIYKLMVEMNGYDSLSETVKVEAGRTAKADIQMKVAAARLEVTTLSPRKDWYSSDGKVFYYWEIEGRVRYPNKDNDIYPMDYGFVFSYDSNVTLESDNPTTYSIHPDDVHEDESTSTITFKGRTHGLYSPNSIYNYYIRAYAINEHGVYYGEARPTK